MVAKGRVVTHRVKSEALSKNPLGDPSERDLLVYEPPDYGGEPIPVLLALAGFIGHGPMLFNADPLGRGLAERLDHLIGSGACPRVVVAAPDCFTRLGGNQYIDSTATGAYETHLVDELVPLLGRVYGATRFGVFGKSSGGFGAIVLGMRHPDVFAAVADHSGDSNFELSYVPDMSDALDAFRAAGGPSAWLESFWADPNRRRTKHLRPLNMLAMAAHYSPNPDAPELGLDFPFDLRTGRLLPDVWARWQAWDPVRMVSRHAEALRRLRLVYVDCGSKDEFGLHWGARALVDELRRAGVDPVFEEFDDGHMNVSYRFDRSIPLLVRALSDS
jgi:S-formylglutathione hydrolase FrmB